MRQLCQVRLRARMRAPAEPAQCQPVGLCCAPCAWTESLLCAQATPSTMRRDRPTPCAHAAAGTMCVRTDFRPEPACLKPSSWALGCPMRMN
jgi:hypothetical protein